jgi:LacI family transcriptional regulator
MTIKEIAKEVGVSSSAVSHVLNGRNHKVSEKKGKEIEDALKKHHYHRNGLVRAMKEKRTWSLAVLLPSIRFSFYAEILESIENEARQRGYHVYMLQTKGDREIIRTELKHLQERRVDGYIVMPDHHDRDIYQELLDQRDPFVIVDSYIEGLAAPYVDTDDKEGGRMIAQHLCDRGHCQFLILAAAKNDLSPMATGRLKGYLEVLDEAGIPPEDIHIFHGGLYINDGITSVQQALDQKLRFTAVIGMTDMVAIGATQALLKAGLSIPQDVAVAGYGHIDQGQLMTPSLTTVHQHPEVMGEKVTDLLIQIIENKKKPDSVIILQDLVIGEST